MNRSQQPSSSDSRSAADLIGLLDRFADAWNRHDLDALMSMMTGDCVFEASAGPQVDGQRSEGQQAVRAAYAAVFETFPDAHWANARHLVAGDRGVSEWTFSGTQKDGTRVEVTGCDLFTFRDGMIAVKNSFRKHRPADGATFRSHRVLPYPPQSVFDAFARPDLLARWWGPAGFTNTFEVFEFRPGGRWKFVMHGPDGSHPRNESVFRELQPSKLVIQHVSRPRYLLTVMLAAHDAGTAITWVQEFEDSAVAARIRHIVEPANEQNLDRLAAVLAGA